MKERPIYILWMVVLLYQRAPGQDYYYNNQYYDQTILFQMGISVGAMNCLTDLGGKRGIGKSFVKDINWKNNKVCGGLFLGMMYKYLFCVNMMISGGKIGGFDGILGETHTASDLRYQRNLSFSSSILELSILSECYPANIWAAFLPRGRPSLSPFLLLGVGVFHFNPMAKLDGQWYPLHSLHTEGQGFNEYPDRKIYKLTQSNFQVGFGVRYEISALCDLRMETNYRILKTDYLDDVSTNYIDPKYFQKYMASDMAAIAKRIADRQVELNPGHVTIAGEKRGGQSKNDGYYSITLRFGYTFNRSRR